MKRPVCELAQERPHHSKDWRRHAAACPDCVEILKVGEWMDRFADATTMPKDLPSPGLLLFKAKLRTRVLSAERAARPIHTMAIFALFFTVASTGAVIFGTESRFGSILTEALQLVGSNALIIAVAAAATAIICTTIAFVSKRLEA